ncbi:TolC family protein [Treponema sp. TIM-1]|uniref:TolC family protein n=1 Tax=Treponema sp. TIM-1 TaxID=2898417 RepID=UPI0039813E78
MIPRFHGARRRQAAACPRGIKIPFREFLCTSRGKHKKPFAPPALVCFFLIFPGLAFGQDQPPPGVRVISPDEAVELAVKNNLGLESVRIGTGTQKRASDLSWNQFIPSITLGGSVSRDNKASTTTIPALPPIVVENPRWHIAGSVQASLNLNAAMFERLRTLRLNYEGGLIGYEKARAQLERDVRKAYYQILLIQENIALLRQSYAAAERQVTMAQANYRAGLVPELTVLQARVSMENLKPTIDQAEHGLNLNMVSLANYLGLPLDTRFELIPVENDTVFIPLDTAKLISKAASGKPDILELKHQLLTLESSRRAQILSLTPSLTLSWNSNQIFIQDPWKDDWGNKDFWQQSGSLTLSLGVQLHSLIPFSTNFQAIKDLDDSIKSAHIGLAQAIRGTELEIYSTVMSLEQARSTVEALTLTVDLAERTYRLTEEAYQAGLREVLEVQNAELELRRARIGVLEQNFNYLQGLIDLEYAMGVPFGTLSGSQL